MNTYEAKNEITGEVRDVEITLEELRDVTFDIEHDTCSGPCECTVEPDGSCPQGWPSKSQVAGIL